MHLRPFSIGVSLLLAAIPVSAYGKGDPRPLEYSFADRVEVSCLNRSMETGEHIQDKTGALQYVPFATCEETGLPLSFDFHRDSPQGREVNCTIPFLSDEMFHLLEFYIHHDSPLACRVPVKPLDGEYEVAKVGVDGISESGAYVPLVFSIAGKLEFSHLHIANQMNVLFHLSSPGVINSATGYSISPLTQATRIIIGDPLPLRFSVRWYDTTALPSMTSGILIDDEGSLFWPIILGIIVVGALGAVLAALYKRKGKGRGMDGIIGNGYSGSAASNGKGSFARSGYPEGSGYGGFKGVAVRGGDSGSGGYGYGGFSGKRKD